MEIAVAVFLYSFMIGALSMFLQECYKPKMVFHLYFKWLEKKYDLAEANNPVSWRLNIYKPLGLCIYCQNFWINTILFPFYFGTSNYYILSIGGTYLSIELIRLIKAWNTPKAK